VALLGRVDVRVVEWEGGNGRGRHIAHKRAPWMRRGDTFESDAFAPS